ncbi:hypothetical protein F0P96_10530 [Hymenobacter busanensis]|uniref:Uncharacterized protein n=1 Tax=Hymenobacter busanensis TaxID=2607656 RepID=A0A7L4ZWQ9_9BACT|nr:hypothetical protein [Hymenobacter busanensis]KAA9333396.1 hypothetical protein F0P96_10530 [Hymenobacter busanensis]QHJ07924.1 hypothetical protein GUY19_11775 [Hymenobacter busanensis]
MRYPKALPLGMPTPKHPYGSRLIRLWLRRHLLQLAPSGFVVATVGPYVVSGFNRRLRTVSRM